jgi:hypothetical protein
LRPIFESESQKSSRFKNLFAHQKFFDIRAQISEFHDADGRLSNAEQFDDAFPQKMG